MIRKQDYQAVFSQITASGETYRRVLNMTKHSTQKHTGRRIAVLIAAVIALVAMAVTAFASEYVQNWFVSFFADRSDAELTQNQVAYIEENVQNINDAQIQDGWTVELRSAIHDGTTAYVVFMIKGPEGMDLSQWTDEQGNIWGNFIFGNMSAKSQRNGTSDLLTWSGNVLLDSWGMTWINDGDNLPNTRSLLFRLNPNMSKAKVDPFGNDAVYHFHMENIIWESEDREYLMELKNGKYAGETSVMYTPEEIEKLYCEELLAEGIWDFTICFGDWGDDISEYVELLTEPQDTRSNVFRSFGPEIENFGTVEDTVTLTSVRMRHLTVRFCYKSIDGIPDFELFNGDEILRPCIVLKDGTRVKLLPHSNGGNGAVTLDAEIPIVFEDVDYILMADGTIIEMPG